MKTSLPLGRIAGVRVGINLSVLVIVAILVAGLGFSRFPELLPGRSVWAYLSAAALATTAFLASLLAHEVAHAVLARRNGIEVESITLWVFGGVAKLKGDPQSPGADLRIAAAGPLTSLVLGVGFGAVALLFNVAGIGGLPIAVLGYLAGVNILLALFNLIPAAPLDGGRVLRALLWLVWNDRHRAAITAARAGRVFGSLLAAYGFLQFMLGGGFDGMWLVLIGLFLVSAAHAEEQHTRITSSLHGVTVGHVMTPNPVIADPDVPVSEFIQQMTWAHRFSSYPLTDAAGRLTGLVTLNRIRKVAPERRATTRLRDVACPPDQIVTVRADEPLAELLPRMSGCADGRAVVIDEYGTVVGIVSPSDAVRAIQLASLRSAHRTPQPTPHHGGSGTRLDPQPTRTLAGASAAARPTQPR